MYDDYREAYFWLRQVGREEEREGGRREGGPS